MGKRLSLILMLLCAVFTGAWAQTTVIARMQDLVSAASTNTATVSSEWRASEGDVYVFGDNHFIGGITNSSVLSAMEGNQYVTIAMYVYGNSLRGCPFGYGDSQDGLKFVFASNSNFTADTYGTTVRMTTKSVADFSSADLGSMSANAWNLVAISFPGKSNSSASQSRYISPAGHYPAFNTTYTMKNPATSSKKFAIGSGDQGTAREAFYGMIANVTVMTSSSLLTKDDVLAKMGAAPQNGSNDYAIGFTNTTHTETGRQISAIRLGDQEISINGAGNVYQDLTETASFTINAGEVVKPAIVWNGAWMDGYVYVDTDSSDKQFTVGEMVSSATGHDPHSSSLLNNFGTFHIDNAGDYRMRYKVEWDHTDPTGNGGHLIENGGYVLDVMLHVVDPVTMIDASFTYQSTSGASWTVNKSIAEGTILNIDDYDNFDFYQNFAFADGTDTEVSESNKQFVINCEDNFPFEVGKLCRIQSLGTSGKNKDYYAAEKNGSWNAWVNFTYGGVTPPTMAANSNLWYFSIVEGTPDIFTVRNFTNNKYITLSPTTGTTGLYDTPQGSVDNPSTTSSYFRLRKNANTTNPVTPEEGMFSLQHIGALGACVSLHNSAQQIGYWAGDNVNTPSNGDNILRVLPIESFTTTLNAVPGDGFYGTIYLPFNMETSMAEVYAATASEGIMQLHKVEGVAPAGAYILRIPYAGCAEGEKETEPITASNETPTTVERNVLSGTLIEGKAFDSVVRYALSGKNGIGFYKYIPNTYPVAKAVYIPAETTQVSAFYFDFGNPVVTAIQELQKEHQEQGTIFDLQGRRIQKAQKGMNIINGRKVLR